MKFLMKNKQDKKYLTFYVLFETQHKELNAIAAIRQTRIFKNKEINHILIIKMIQRLQKATTIWSHLVTF